jgi:hypothetical protein
VIFSIRYRFTSSKSISSDTSRRTAWGPGSTRNGDGTVDYATWDTDGDGRYDHAEDNDYNGKWDFVVRDRNEDGAWDE